MEPIEISAGQFEVVSISGIDELSASMRQGAVTTYQQAFGRPPYNEAFTAEAAEAALTYIFEQDGDVFLGKIGEKVA